MFAPRFLPLALVALTLCAAPARADEPPTATATPAPTHTPAPLPTPTAAHLPAPPRAETPNAALSLVLPQGWTARSLKGGLSLEPPGTLHDETIVAACEPFPITGLTDETRLEDLLARLKAGQLATFEDAPRPRRDKVKLAAGPALVVTFKGTDDGGRPAALRITILPCDGRVAILTARLPAKRLEQRTPDLEAIQASFAVVPAEAERALRAGLVGSWSTSGVPGVVMRFLANGTFEETRAPDPALPKRGAASLKGGSFEVIGREIRLRFDDGATRAFRVDEVGPHSFTSAGQLWQRGND